MEETERKSWEIWFSIFLIAIGIALFLDAGHAGIRGSEVGSGFLPKVASGAMIGFSALNLFSVLRGPKPERLAPTGYVMALVLLAIGLLGVLAFLQFGMLVALFLLFFAVFSLFERKVRPVNLVFAIAVAYAIHGFFIGLLGIWDPAGALVDLRWLTPW